MAPWLLLCQPLVLTTPASFNDAVVGSERPKDRALAAAARFAVNLYACVKRVLPQNPAASVAGEGLTMPDTVLDTISAGSTPVYEIVETADRLTIIIRSVSSPDLQVHVMRAAVPRLVEALQKIQPH